MTNNNDGSEKFDGQEKINDAEAEIIRNRIVEYSTNLCRLAVAVGMPHCVMQYVLALITVSREKYTFKATNTQIAAQLASTRDITPDSAERTVTRLAKKIYTWQDKEKIALVLRDPGHRNMKTGKCYPSEYTLPVLSALIDISKGGGWRRLPFEARDEIIQSLRIPEGDKMSPSTQKNRGGNKPKFRKPSSKLNSALKLIQSVRGKTRYEFGSRGILVEIEAEVVAEIATGSEGKHNEKNTQHADDYENVHDNTVNTEWTDSYDGKGAQGGADYDN